MFYMPEDVKIDINHILDVMSDAVKVVTDRNFFNLQGEASALEYLIKDIKNHFPPSGDPKSENENLFWEVFRRKIVNIKSTYEKIISSLNPNSSFSHIFTQLQAILSILSQLKVNEDILSIISNIDPEIALAKREPHVFLRNKISSLLKKLRESDRVWIDKKSFHTQVINSISPDLVNQQIIEDALNSLPTFSWNDLSIILLTPLSTLVPKFLSSIHRPEIRYSELLTIINMDETTVDIILDYLENEGRVVRDRTADSGEILYFPEFS